MSIPDRDNPIDLFKEWFYEARQSDLISEPTAMTVATVDEHGMPWARIVLMKDVSDAGFTFFTNLASRKAVHLHANPKAGLCFHWMDIDKQVRVQGRVTQVDDDQADAYFETRPRESQIGAWASVQSATLSGRAELEGRFQEFSAKFEGKEVPRPEFWSGFCLSPDVIEFWLRAPFRLHDRRIYRRAANAWTSELLYP